MDLDLQIDYNALIGCDRFALTFLVAALSHALELSLYVDATYRAVLAGDEPLVDAIAMEQVHAW